MPMPSAGDEARDAPPVRAFAQGAGVLMQIVGGVLFFGSCCVCSALGAWDPTMSRGEAIRTYAADPTVGYSLRSMLEHPNRAGVALLIAASTVGGLGMLVFGLGLQAEKRRAGWGAAITTWLLAAAMVVAGVLLWSGPGGWGYRIWNAVMLPLTVLLAGFATVALRQMRRHPPPDDLYTVPADYDPKQDTH